MVISNDTGGLCIYTDRQTLNPHGSAFRDLISCMIVLINQTEVEMSMVYPYAGQLLRVGRYGNRHGRHARINTHK